MEVFSTRQIIGQIELMFLLFRLVFLQGRKCWAGVSSYVMSGLTCHYTWFFISHLGYFTRSAITLLRDIKQWLSISMGFNPDNFLSFWRFNPLSKIKQQKLTKQTSSQKENKVVKVEDFFSSEQFSLKWSILFAQFLWDGGKYLSCPEKRAMLCSDLYLYKYHWRELKLHLGSNGEIHIDVDFLLNVYLLPFVHVFHL